MIQEKTIENFTEELSSKAPIPGGGGASALAGALGASLGAMVANLTIGKKKYADVEADIRADLKICEETRLRFLRLADKDEEVFLPLSKAYGMPKDTEENRKIRDIYMEQVLYDASLVPLGIMEAAAGFTETLADLAAKGSRLAISDAGVAAAYIRTCITGAAYNVRINTKSMKDEERRNMIDSKADMLLRTSAAALDEIEKMVKERI